MRLQPASRSEAVWLQPASRSEAVWLQPASRSEAVWLQPASRSEAVWLPRAARQSGCIQSIPKIFGLDVLNRNYGADFSCRGEIRTDRKAQVNILDMILTLLVIGNIVLWIVVAAAYGRNAWIDRTDAANLIDASDEDLWCHLCADEGAALEAGLWDCSSLCAN